MYDREEPYVGPWETDITKVYYCHPCKKNSAYAAFRRRTDRDGTSYKEYKIVCKRCGAMSTAHRARHIAEHAWMAKNGGDRK